ncbi:hypothetical protein SM124_06075 [Bacillus sp. 31A1R]|uniref:Uncharacterized protein n=1 Tax=Robertmurraya mangrovi TaxID=3098077 RepID=A0ABU5IW07_9BACI|nr:hypothetical protein [Bacillus sp. 31A1R]MDZ5471310.1 hypothetical protein [Bacillus sp. 31A1R]
MLLEGRIISGEFDEEMNEFSLQRVKNMSLESTIRENQLMALYEYLKKHQKDTDGQVITLYDQLPLRLSQEEIQLLMRDLDQLRSLYQ